MECFWNFGSFVARVGEGRETHSIWSYFDLYSLSTASLFFKLFANAWQVLLSSSSLLSLWVDPVIPLWRACWAQYATYPASVMYWKNLLPQKKVCALGHTSGFSSMQKHELLLVMSGFLILLLLHGDFATTFIWQLCCNFTSGHFMCSCSWAVSSFWLRISFTVHFNFYSAWFCKPAYFKVES